MTGCKYEYWLSPKGLSQIKSWIRQGETETAIAGKIGISPRTLREWKRKFQPLFDAMQPAALDADLYGANFQDTNSQIEEALLRKASGYTVNVLKTYKVRRVEYDGGKKVCELEELVQGMEQMYVPPDLSAQIFWLRNRMPDKWQDKADVGKTSLLKLDEALGDLKNAVIKQETDRISPEC